MRRIGITGGIGSGKSFVSSILRNELGVPVYDCDAESKRLTAENETIRVQLAALVGEDVFDGRGGLNRERLASYLFASEEHAKAVESIVHPQVREDFRQWCTAQRTSIVAMESAILYESGFDAEVDEVLFVAAPIETRIARAMERDGCPRKAIHARMARQDTELAREKASWIIKNEKDATKETILKQLKRIKLC